MSTDNFKSKRKIEVNSKLSRRGLTSREMLLALSRELVRISEMPGVELRSISTFNDTTHIYASRRETDAEFDGRNGSEIEEAEAKVSAAADAERKYWYDLNSARERMDLIKTQYEKAQSALAVSRDRLDKLQAKKSLP